MAGCSLSTLLRSTCYRPCPPFAYTYGDGVVAGTLTRDILRVHSIKAVTVANVTKTQVPLSLKGFDSLGNGGMIIDSGTTYTHLPEPFYTQLLSVLQSVITYPRATEVEERSGFDLCYRIPCDNNNNIVADDLPSITLHFLNNVSITLPRGNSFYAMSAPSNSSVAKCLLFQSMDESSDDDHYGPAGVLGSFQQQNVEVVYDLEKERIGFQVADCALAAVTQGLQKT
ncbi:hypothetical protein DH2020_009058 [Rehmannia glutinosa]|uniref:Peptidase A1 domain-containing protein n=1 Tax=Rehmannia glutinosa TaxID=99300 RepID=A0ABR0X8M7_REHGL